MNKRAFSPLIMFSLLLSSVSVLQAANKKIEFNKDIRRILSNNCFHCHGPDAEDRKGDLRLDTKKGATLVDKGVAAIVPGSPEKSELIARIMTDDEDDVMPPKESGKVLSPEDKALLKEWIKQGADYQKHWAYVKPVRPELPKVKDKTWVKNPIDQFILAKLEANDIQPAPASDRQTLIRKLSLDITGLPPSYEETQAYIHDKKPGATDRVVDALLKRPSFGEHWSRMWLDLARYADTAGYGPDGGRTIWAYRDYVIKSFNQNKPYDVFTREQLGGDLMKNPSQEQLIATAFHRNTQTNSEGGTVDEEFRNVAVVDRVNTTMSVWMGTTMACAQCHTHKYDPITHKEYFQLFSIFNNTEDSDRQNEHPVMQLYKDGHEEEKKRLDVQFQRIKPLIENHTPETRKSMELWLAQMKKNLKDKNKKQTLPKNISKLVSAKSLNRRQSKELELYYLSHQAPQYAETQKLYRDLKNRLNGIRPYTSVPVFRELHGDKRRKTHIQIRGNYLVKGEEVQGGFPNDLHPMKKKGPYNRLSVADWLMDQDNPLTARVTVNRYWEKLFGTGLVETSEEFGSQGQLPSHPELLDWLATELIASDWDLKHLIKLMVTSAAYQQTSKIQKVNEMKDPNNRLVSRGPRFRLTAEMVRDQALAVSGLLSAKMYGPPVRPPQPNLGVKASFGGSVDWKTSTGEDRYRRAIYTTWRRSNPYPSMVAFDAPNREVCVIRRDSTNTPLQAFVTLNDPVYIETAQALARRGIKKSNKVNEAILECFRISLTRDPSEKEMASLLSLYQDTYNMYKKKAHQAKTMATNPIGPAPKGSDITQLAALTVVANTLLNLDEILMKR